MWILSKGQNKVLTTFFTDIAKGIFLAVILGQILSTSVPFLIKLFISIFILILGIFCLSGALYFSKNELW